MSRAVRISECGIHHPNSVRGETALIPQMTIPTGSSAFNNGRVLPGANLSYSWEINDSFFLTAEDADVDEVIHECLFKTRNGKPYRLLFTIIGNGVRVLHVRGPGQDFMKGDELDLAEDPK